MNFSYSPIFKRQFRKLPRGLQRKVMERLALFRSDERHPLLNNHPLKAEWNGCRGINITGDYRLVFKKESDALVRLEQVGTHSELYGK